MPRRVARLVEAEGVARFQIERPERRRTARFTRRRPALVAVPMVFAGVVKERRRRRGLGAPVSDTVEERPQHLAAELLRGVAVPLQRARGYSRRSSPGCAAKAPSRGSSDRPGPAALSAR